MDQPITTQISLDNSQSCLLVGIILAGAAITTEMEDRATAAILLEKSLKARETSTLNKYAVLTLSEYQRIVLNGFLLYYTCNFGENTRKIKDNPGCHPLEMEHDIISEMLQELQFILS